LPLAPCPTSETRISRTTPQTPPVLKGKSLLLAEDNKINQTIFTKMVAPTNADCLIANDGLEALELIKERDFDIVFLDIQMPHLDGLEVCKRVRKFDANLPIIAVTANIFEADIRTYLDAGFTAHLGKPIDMSKLYRELQWHCLDKSL